MKEGKINKTTDLVRIDSCVYSRVKAHKEVSGVPMAVFVEECINERLAALYPDGVIKKK